MRILVIDGDSAPAVPVQPILAAEGFNVTLADTGEEFIDLAKLYDFDAIILDLQLPDMTGFEALRRIRSAKVRTPILILSRMALVSDIVKGLGMGADDYLTKPFHKDELVARLNMLVRRCRGFADSIIETGNIILNLNTKTIKVDGNALHLTGKEYQMFELLSLRKGITLTKEAFLTHLYGGMDEPELKIIDVFICKLRKKFAKVNGHRIETVWGRGYVLRDADARPVDMSSEVASLADEPPTGFVSQFSQADRRQKDIRDGKFKPAGKGVHIKIPATA